MNILIISPKFHPVIGGGETYVLNSIERLHNLPAVTVSIAVEPVAERNIDDYPYDVYEIDGLSDSNLNIISASAGLNKLLKQLNPDIIHVHGYFGLLIVGLCNLSGIPVVASVHSTPVWGERIVGGMGSFETELQFARFALDIAKPVVLTAANDVYANAAKKISEHRCPVITLPYPVDIEFFYNEKDRQLRETFNLSSTDVLMMTPSRIIERKGIREIVQALHELPDNFYLCLPGAVEPLDQKFWLSIISDAQYKKIRHRVIIPTEKILYNIMPRLYAASEIITMPSYYEGAPVATVEAMASGKPFVGADSQGINGFIVHEKNGLLVPQKNVPELARAILKVANDKTIQNEYSQRAREDIKHLSWDVQLQELVETYEDAVAKV